MEQDRIPGFWIVTAWPLENDIVLRLRIAHETNDELCQFMCEIRVRGEHEFEYWTVHISIWDMLDENKKSDEQLELFPEIWRKEFCDMARRWVVCAWILEYRSVTEVRYAAEPDSSRDFLEFPPHERAQASSET